MRIALFSFLLLFSSRILPAQSIPPFLNASQWYVSDIGLLGTDYRWWMMGKDSLIGGEVFVQVLDSLLPTQMWVREDVATHRVWFASSSNGYQPRLLYDFGLTLGDTVTLEFDGFGPRQFVFSSTLPLLTTMGIYDDMILETVQPGFPSSLNWAPGAGNNQHPFYLAFITATDPSYHLVCNYVQGNKFYDDGFFACPGESPPLGVQEHLGAASLLAGYEPHTGELWMDLPAGKGLVEWRLHDFQGRLLAKGSRQGAGTSRHYVGSLPSANYLLVVQDGKGQATARQFLTW